VEYSRFIGLLPDGGVPMGGAGGEADGGPVCVSLISLPLGSFSRLGRGRPTNPWLVAPRRTVL
jgi:hypothetical protein